MLALFGIYYSHKFINSYVAKSSSELFLLTALDDFNQGVLMDGNNCKKQDD